MPERSSPHADGQAHRGALRRPNEQEEKSTPPTARGGRRSAAPKPTAAHGAPSRSGASSGARRPARWQLELGRVVTTGAELGRWLELSEEEQRGLEAAERAGWPLRVTRSYLELCDRADPGCPIRRQIVPSAARLDADRGERRDPLDEEGHEMAPRLIRRYPDRALLLVTDCCAGHCRFCTRSRSVGRGAGAATGRALSGALEALRRTPEIRDVIVSGGDPLTMTTAALVSILRKLRAIEHIEVIRIGTRTPVYLPSRVTSRLVRALRPLHPIWIMTHFNHPKELTAEAARACRRLVDGGFPVMNQTVLLRGVNDDAQTLTTLFRALVRWRVRPYYLMQMDPVAGSSRLRTPLEAGVEIMRQLQGRLSGIALPKLVLDTPGGHGKVPLGPDYVLAREPGLTRLRTPRGAEVDYLDPPASAKG